MCVLDMNRTVCNELYYCAIIQCVCVCVCVLLQSMTHVQCVLCALECVQDSLECNISSCTCYHIATCACWVQFPSMSVLD